MEVDREEVRSRIEELARISKELEANAKMQANAANIIAAEQLKKRVTELTELQSKKMRELVAMHHDEDAKRRYGELSLQIDETQLKIKATKDMQELKQLEAEIESVVSQYVHHFQTMVSQLMGAPAPDKPVFG